MSDKENKHAAVNRLQVVPNHTAMFDQILEQANLNQVGPDCGEVMFVTKTNEDEEGSVEVLILFPADDPAENAVEPYRQLVACRFTLNAFLNGARMLALQHNVKLLPDEDMPEAFTSEEAGKILLTPGKLN